MSSIPLIANSLCKIQADMTNQIEYRPYSPGDELAILGLFQNSFGKKLTKDYWKWRFEYNPTGQLLIELAWHEETLISHYAVSPVELSVMNQNYITALSMTSMTHPNYRGRGIFAELANRIYERLKQHEYLMVWGFPNSQSHRVFINQLKWKDIYEIPTLHLNLDELYSIPEVSKYIIELDTFDTKFDDLWEKAGSSSDIAVKRNQEYLNWRYALNPQNKYRIIAYMDNNELLGYIVFKEYNSDIDIVDILAVQYDNIGKELILAILDFAQKKETIKSINIWLAINNPLHHQLEKMGFIHSMPVTYFGARFLDKSKPHNVDAKTFQHWHIQMGDSDVY